MPKLKLEKLSFCVLVGPPQGDNENSLISGHSGPPQRKPWNPKIVSIALETDPKILPTPPKISLIFSKIGANALSISPTSLLIRALVHCSTAQSGACTIWPISEYKKSPTNPNNPLIIFSNEQKIWSIIAETIDSLIVFKKFVIISSRAYVIRLLILLRTQFLSLWTSDFKTPAIAPVIAEIVLFKLATAFVAVLI